MTPAARWAAAAQIMDEISAGDAAEKALTQQRQNVQEYLTTYRKKHG